MLAEKGYDFWKDTLLNYARGTYFKRIVTTRPYTPEEIEKLPPKHQARTAPEGTVLCTRAKIKAMHYPLVAHIANLPDVIFDNAKPVFKEGLKDIHEFETREYPDDV